VDLTVAKNPIGLRACLFFERNSRGGDLRNVIVNQVCGYCEKCGFAGVLLRRPQSFVRPSTGLTGAAHPCLVEGPQHRVMQQMVWRVSNSSGRFVQIKSISGMVSDDRFRE